MYLESKINQMLDSVRNELIGVHTYSHLIRTLNRVFKPERFMFKIKKRPYFSEHDLSVSGLYDIEQDLMIIYLLVSKDYNHFEITKKSWKKIKFAISQTCQHEAIHQHQWQFKDYQPDKGLRTRYNFPDKNYREKIYLSDPDEIEAYAHDIAMEIKFFYPNRNSLEVLKHAGRFKKLWSYQYYLHTFYDCNWDFIRSKLIKKTYKWLGA